MTWPNGGGSSDTEPAGTLPDRRPTVTEGEHTLEGARERFRKVFRGACDKLEGVCLEGKITGGFEGLAVTLEFINTMDEAHDEYLASLARLTVNQSPSTDSATDDDFFADFIREDR